jgi:AcrR family transcriptional regulator
MVLRRSRPSAKAKRPGSRRRDRARLSADARRASLVRLGVELFGASSYEDVSIDEVARRAGISRGLLYHYFRTKRDFYLETVRAAAAELHARTAADDSLPAIERFRASLDGYLSYVEEHAVAYATLLRGGLAGDRELLEIVESARRDFVRRIEVALRVERPLAVVRLGLRGWVGFVEAVVLEWIGEASVERRVVMDLLLRSMGGLLVAWQQLEPSLSLPLSTRRALSGGTARD